MPLLARKPLQASCHCGAIRLEVRRKPRTLTDCNCSICRRYGTLWAYYSRKSVKIIASGDALTGYSRGRRSLQFRRCATCGCVVYHEPTRPRGDATRLGVNARLMDPADIADVRVRRLDGAKTWKYLD